MKIPDVFRAVQSSVFQDKTIEHFSAQEIKGKLAGVVTNPGQLLGSYKVNFSFIKDEIQAQEYGLRAHTDALITSSASLPMKQGEYVKYGGRFYKIKECLVYDSHMKWLVIADEYTN